MHAYIYRCLWIYRKRAQADCYVCWTNPQDTALAFTYFSPLLFWLTSRIGLVSFQLLISLPSRRGPPFPRPLSLTADCVSVLRSQRKNHALCVSLRSLVRSLSAAAQQSQSKQNVAASRTKAISKRRLPNSSSARQSALSEPRRNKKRPALDLSFTGVIVILELSLKSSGDRRV